MPTLLDSFIIELKLDATQFTDSQRKAAEALEQVESRATRAAGGVEKTGAGVVTFFRGIEAPLAALRRQFESLATPAQRSQRNLSELAAQGRRTGDSVEAGALDGAAGLRVLGVAGLTAFATITALDKVMRSAGESARNVFGVGVGAATAGVAIQQFSAISQALLHLGNVPEAESQGWMAQYRNAQEQAKLGHPEAAIAMNTRLAQMGITDVDVLTTAPEEALLRIAKRFHEVSTAEASAYGDLIGLSATLSQALHNLGDKELEAAIQAERHRAVTEADSDAARELTKAQNNLQIAWGKLTRVLYDDVDPALTWIANKLADIFGGIAGGEEAQRNAPPGTRYAPPGTSWVPEWWQKHAPWWLGGGHTAAPGSGSGSTSQSSFIPPSGADEAVIRQTVAAAGGNAQTQAAFLAMFNAENEGLSPSGLEAGVPGNAGVGGRGGASYAQWTGPRRRKLEEFGWTGTDPVRDREASAKMLYWELTQSPDYRGLVDRMNAASSATDAAILGGRVYEQGGGDASMFGYGRYDQAGLDRFHSSQAERFMRRGGDTKSFTAPRSAPDHFTNEGAGGGPADTSGARLPDPSTLTGRATQPPPGPGAGIVGSGYDNPNTAAGRQLDAIRRGQQSSLGRGDVTHNYGDINVAEVNVAVHEGGGSPEDIGSHLGATVRNAIVTQANTGLS